ncbi:hypothetical protein U1Q18_035994 [Sarracenia purpurea var. burkii]
MVFDEKPKPYPCNKQGATILPTPMPSGDFDSKAASNLLGDLCLLGDREKQEGVNGKLSARARKMDNGLPQPCVEDKGFATEEEWFATEEWSKKDQSDQYNFMMTPHQLMPQNIGAAVQPEKCYTNQ